VISTHRILALAMTTVVLLGVGCFMSSSSKTNAQAAKAQAAEAPAVARVVGKPSKPGIPPLDRAVPAEVATATFAMG